MTENDVLEVLPDEDIPKLRDLYKDFLPRTAHVYNFLNCVIRWKKQRPDREYVTVMTPNGNWRDGTFVAVQKWSCYGIFLFSLEESCETLYRALARTRAVDWNRLMELYAVQKDQFPAVLRVLNEVEFPIHHSNFYDVWWISKEKALNLNIDDCPPEVYVKKLEPTHAGIVNSHWPSSFPGSEEYLSTFIELNGGFGVFLKSCNTLVAWILRNQIGMGALQTVDEHKRKGYGALVTKHLAREVAEDGDDPLGTVPETNLASRGLFKKLGFTVVETVVFTESEILHKA